eukprot:m.110917 g.110917  ORF g.110917 m.110917 type:complete len:493 (+) comp9355_c0_seq1:3149-4627(+)
MAALTGRPVLGLDIGTTSVKACLLDASGGVLAAVAQQHDAYRAQREFTKAASSTLPEHDHRRAEQSPRAIADALAVAIAGLPAELRAQVRAVGITGQMHGVLLWQAADPQSTGSPRFEERGLPFLVPPPLAPQLTSAWCSCGMQIATGYGCATLAWWAAEEPQILADHDCAGSIQDWIVAQLTGNTQVVTDATLAHSWGFFNAQSNHWDLSQESSLLAGIERWLPRVVAPGTAVGRCDRSALALAWGLPVDAVVLAGTGDHQSYVYAILSSQLASAEAVGPLPAIISIGTSAQISVVAPWPSAESEAETFNSVTAANASFPAVQLRPYYEDRVLLCAATLNGGNTLAVLEHFFAQVVTSLAPTIKSPRSDSVFQTMLLAGLEHLETPVQVSPTFHGERHSPELAHISNMGAQDLAIGPLVAATCRGIISNLIGLLPPILCSALTATLGTGSALVRNPVLQHFVRQTLDIPLKLIPAADACTGAALLALKAEP